jgi:rhamnogalacturonyl hydrolase YesR
MYMVPPLLAYYGIASASQDLVLSAYTQCALYRSYLRDSSTGSWKHVR